MEEHPIYMTMFLQNLSSVLALPFCKMARYNGFREIQLMQVFVDCMMNHQKNNYGNNGRLEGHLDVLCHFEHCRCFLLKVPGTKAQLHARIAD